MVGSYQIMIKPVKVGKKSVRRSRPRKGLLVRGTFLSFGPKLKDPCYRHFTSKGLADAEEAERNGELDWKTFQCECGALVAARHSTMYTFLVPVSHSQYKEPRRPVNPSGKSGYYKRA
jgi:hypothetical protein